jgi:putative ribosome biogenesis GTPase RsgA
MEVPKIIQSPKEVTRICDFPGCTKPSQKQRTKCSAHRTKKEAQRTCKIQGCNHEAEPNRTVCRAHRSQK